VERGTRNQEPDDVLSALALLRGRLGPCADRISWFPEIGSTNDEALLRAEAGAPEGVVIVADAQTRGRGRLGRTWVSPPGAGIYASVVLRPARHTSLLTLAAGVAIADAIQASTGLCTILKWPNDIYVPMDESIGRKLAGILVEAGTSRTGGATSVSGPYAVLGFGINVQPAAYAVDVAGRATCIERELGRTVDRGLVLADCLAAIWRRYEDLQNGRADDVLAAWRTRAASTFGRAVRWDEDGGVASGVADGIGPDGALLVRAGSGLRRIMAGEVRWD
jgi:BirA family biotin operon repressor/biotin-[acetyl-CoA-carboxylase] ligase